MRYAVENTTMTGIADAVRRMRHENARMTPSEIQGKIAASRLGVPINVSVHVNPETGEWERPEDWPDIDDLAAQIDGDQDCLYLTYDLRKTPGYGWIGLYGVTGDKTPWTVSRGHVSGGVFVVDEEIFVDSGAYLRRPLNEDDGDVQLWRITSDGHITNTGFATNGTVNANNYQNNLQPCVQRAGTLPWCVNWFGSVGVNYNHTSGGTQWLERDALVPGKLAPVTTLANCWQYCYSLQSLDLSGWDTSGWAVTTLANCWNACYSLQSLDLSGWDTSGWDVTTLDNCWNACYSLQSLDLSGWDTSGWAVTLLTNCWSACYSLQSLEGPEKWAWIKSLTANTSNPNNAFLRDFGGIPIGINHSYSSALQLTPDSLVRILETLPVVTVVRTLTLGQSNKLKLTEEQIAIATDKGWTVA